MKSKLLKPEFVVVAKLFAVPAGQPPSGLLQIIIAIAFAILLVKCPFDQNANSDAYIYPRTTYIDQIFFYAILIIQYFHQSHYNLG